jgi:hypothetical protein
LALYGIGLSASAGHLYTRQDRDIASFRRIMRQTLSTRAGDDNEATAALLAMVTE